MLEVSVVEPVRPHAVCPVCSKPVEFKLRSNWQETLKFFGTTSEGMTSAFCYERVSHDECDQEIRRREEEELRQVVVRKRREDINRFIYTWRLPLDFNERTFARFVPGSEANEKVLNAVRAWKFTDDFGLLIMGASGTGKSHLAMAILNTWFENFINSPVVGDYTDNLIDRGPMPVYWLASNLLQEIKNNEFEFPAKTLVSPLLVLDDLGSENITEWSREIFFRLFEHRLNLRLPVIVTTNLSLNELKDRLHERIVSRILGLCVPLSLTGKDWRTEKMIDRAKVLADRGKRST